MKSDDGAVRHRALPRPLRPFRHRGYRLLVLSMAVSLLGSGVWLVAVVYQVIALGGGPSELSAVATAFSAGLLSSILVGGVAADRLPKRALMIGVEAVKTVGAGAVAVLGLTGALQLWQLAAISFVLGAAEAFFYPAYSALLPQLLPADELLAANGVEGALRPVLQRALGPAVAGLLVGALLPAAAVLLTTGTYLLAMLALLRMPPVAVVPGDGSSPLRDLKEGFSYLLRTGWLFATLAFATVYVLLVIGPIEVLLPFAVRDQAGGGPSEFALVIAGYGVGGAVGSIAVASMRLPRRYQTVMLLCWGAGALPLAVIGVTDRIWLMVAASFVVGVTDAAAMVIWGTLLQRRVPTRLLGRVSSLDFFVSLAFMPVSMAVAGPVGEAVGIPLVFLVVGVVPVFLAVIALLAWRLPRDEIAHPLDAPTGT
ncbi:MFS transporter [Pseudonocardia humida]|uniref:MFS transporter n=1 Tax=Pseudonocardia humida TaxID=2800819 RepID=A0ABT0ZW39_9PSEU|nr:MFS transporter [Pseudonocardia humida]MCO1654952.1 MFS transporter [Pseudonocardia humida]